MGDSSVAQWLRHLACKWACIYVCVAAHVCDRVGICIHTVQSRSAHCTEEWPDHPKQMMIQGRSTRIESGLAMDTVTDATRGVWGYEHLLEAEETAVPLPPPPSSPAPPGQSPQEDQPHHR